MHLILQPHLRQINRQLKVTSKVTPMSELRHSRYGLLAGVETEGLARQYQTHITLIGCGGVGQAVTGMLGAAGIGSLTLIDPEHITFTNIGRLPLMQASDVGRPKVEALADAIRRNHPEQRVICLQEIISSRTLDGLCSKTNIMIDATDNWPTRKLLATYCREKKIPLVSGGALATDGWVGMFMPDGPPLEAWLGQPGQLADTCESVGVLGPLVGIVGNWMAMETLKLIWQSSNPTRWQTLTGRIVYIDGRYSDVRIQPLGNA